MTTLAIRLAELDDKHLENFVDLWLTNKTEGMRVDRVGGAHDKGRDVVVFETDRRHEGAWHLYQCKRKTLNSSLGAPEALTELGKIFHHHVEGAYATLPTKYVFVAPRGVSGQLQDLLYNPSRLGPALIEGWEKRCLRGISAGKETPLTARIAEAIAAFPFERVLHMNAPTIVKDPAARAALCRYLDVPLEEAPRGVVPEKPEGTEIKYLDQLTRAYGAVEGVPFADADAVLCHPIHGEHLRDQRMRFFDAASFKRFHRDSVAPESLEAFSDDVYSGVVDVYRRNGLGPIERVDAVMTHASLLPAQLVRTNVRVTVKQGICHHLANEGRMKWMP